MNFQSVNELVPRPSPKPSRIEVPAVSNGPEVPEASLLFDASIRRTEPARVQPTRDSADRLKTSEDVSVPSYSPSFSGERLLRRTPEQSNCCCGSNTDAHRMNVYNSPIPPHFDCVRKNQSMNLNYESKNGTHTCSRFSPFTKQCMTECIDAGNMNQSFVTLDEYQKMASQFTNMILKLNYKFNQVIDNSISREELNQITRKFELQIENLTQRVNELNNKLQRESFESASRHVAEYKCCQRPNEPVFRRVNEHKCCQTVSNYEPEFSDSHHISGQSPKQCSRSSVQSQPDFEYKNPRRVDMDDLHTDRVCRDRTNLREESQDSPIPENGTFKRTPETLELLQPREMQRQCYSNREHKVSSSNVILSSDLSVLMNTLAMKYIPEGQCESTRQDGMPEYDMVTRNTNNCNNVSMATLQYMERYQLLSSKDRNLTKSLGMNKPRSPTSNQPFDYQGVPESNDRSFVR